MPLKADAKTKTYVLTLRKSIACLLIIDFGGFPIRALGRHMGAGSY